MLSEDCVKTTLETLAIHYPARKLTPDEIDMLVPDWRMDCEDLDDDQFQAAVRHHRRESPYFPTVRDVRVAHRALKDRDIARIKEEAAAQGQDRRAYDSGPGATPQEVREVVRTMLLGAGDPAADDGEALEHLVEEFYPNLGCLSAGQLRAAVAVAQENTGGGCPTEIDILLAHGHVYGHGRVRRDYGRVMAMYCKHNARAFREKAVA